EVRRVLGEPAYEVCAPYIDATLSGQAVSYEGQMDYARGESRYVHCAHVPHLSEEGAVEGFFSIVTDISERKRLESELLHQERLATLGQLTATVSHELRNPLAVIRASAYTLRDGVNEAAPRAQRALERVERSAVRCDRIIDELLDFARISEPKPEATRLDDWLAGVLEEQALPPAVRLHRELGLPEATVYFDHDRLRRAVINVFDNACQAMAGAADKGAAEAGSAALTVQTRETNGRIEMLFEDEGPGIPPHVQEKIFEPLFSTKSFGMGLGLPLVKQIMEQHGGGIEIDCPPGGGTRVCLWLPAQWPGR
ncbi:MAG: hypothetical protein GWO02_05600, partial [Gammaproteobacteria bacterium]|nr:hypothetical protein [Gammaproteobacteria bacterium]